MPKFKVSALFTNPTDRDYNPEWETEITAEFEDDALQEGTIRFREYCVIQKLDHEKYEVHISNS